MLRIRIKNTVMLGTAIVLVLCLSAGYSLAGEPDRELRMNDITGILHEAQEKAKRLLPPVNDHAGEGKTAADVLMEQFSSPAYQDVILEEKQRLQARVFKDILGESLLQSKNHPPAEAALGTERIYLFVSSSIPLTTLRNYAVMIDRARTGKIIMVLRGFVGGMKKIRPTMEFIGEIVKKDPACDLDKTRCDSFQVNIQIDPELFQRFQIQEVPAVTYLPEGEDQDQAEPLVILGDAALDFMLERINREANSNGLKTIITALRSGKGSGERND